jgi:SAM-dependent methyltransferase
MSQLTRHIHESLIGQGLMDQQPQAAKPMIPARTEALSIPTRNGHVASRAVPQASAPKRSVKSARPRIRIKTLNLLYHIWPVASNDLWRWNVEQLLQRFDLFNGRRVVAIVTDEETVSADEVKRAFGEEGHRVEFLTLENNVRLREAGTFLRLLERVQTKDRSVATFYAHAKGVSRARTVHAVEKAWAACMYHYCLDFPERVTEALSRKSMYGASFKVETTWIYPGTFWWFHNASLFEQPDWNTLDNPMTKEGLGWSVEAFPNRFFADDCERVYPAELQYPKDTQFGLYDPRIWTSDVRVASLNERAKWRWGHAVEKEWLTWGKLLSGDGILAAVGRHARLARARILEVGPGYGRFYESLQRKRVPIASYVGIDLSPQRSRELRQKYQEGTGNRAQGTEPTEKRFNSVPCALSPIPSFVWGDIESVKDIEPLGQFDVIVSTLVFKRLCPTFQLAATVCRSALVPGGKLIFDVPETGVDWPATEEAQIGSFKSGWGFGAFSKSYRQDEIRELLDAAGFIDIKFDAIVHDGDKRRLLVIATRG